MHREMLLMAPSSFHRARPDQFLRRNTGWRVATGNPPRIPHGVVQPRGETVRRGTLVAGPLARILPRSDQEGPGVAVLAEAEPQLLSGALPQPLPQPLDLLFHPAVGRVAVVAEHPDDLPRARGEADRQD